ncbi:hypothetical protein LHYA1_G007880 [Lachnellula hyalina]|uniref:Uncharacterized protein n=1 Tax=Lachnellula hyalina TaxID=1316788 RepID=A0A8H8QUX0_9HELO|nr:uncharacterized protein LHYA1_G007880 [Lachnellula hyalina]TVY23148.1 hypothetical protein LHYA1_G007880 [Lachnellula hyalina]
MGVGIGGPWKLKQSVRKIDLAKYVPVMLLTSACYGGGWIQELLLNEAVLHP